jgi:hypothetical protein
MKEMEHNQRKPATNKQGQKETEKPLAKACAYAPADSDRKIAKKDWQPLPTHE